MCIACERKATTAQEPRAEYSAPKASQDRIPPKPTIEIESSLSKDTRSSWKALVTQLPGRQTLDHIHFLEETHGWVASKDAVYQTSDGGKSWQPLRIDLPPNSAIANMFFISPRLGWVVVQKRASLSKYDENHTWLFQTTDGGQSWRLQHEDKASVVARVVFVNEQDGWLIGHRYIGLVPLRFNLLILRTSDQGRSWTDVSAELNRIATDDTGMVNDELVDMLQEGPVAAVVLTSRGKIFKTSNYGQSWSKVAFIPGEPESTCICRLGIGEDGQFWLAGGAYENGKGMWGMLAVEQPNLWKRYRLGNAYFKDALVFSKSHALTCGSIPLDKEDTADDQRLGVILHSADGGRLWTVIYLNKQIKTINALSAADPNSIWAVGEDGLIVHLVPAQLN
jgi:photosystem II stability/assembly factor-like uncharacterized protein